MGGERPPRGGAGLRDPGDARPFPEPLDPVPALAAVAAVTTTLRIGTIVFANDYRHPALLAKEAATLDLLSDGRFEFGLGAGWFQKEYEQAGIAFDPPGQRIDRMREALTIFKGLWGEEPLTFKGTHYAIAGLEGTPKPVQKPHPPIFIGGTGRRMLQLAGQEADIVGFIPKNLPSGGHDWLASTSELLTEQIGWVREGAGARFDQLELSMVAFRAIVTDRPREAAVEVARDHDLTPDQVLASPDFLIGSEDAIVECLLSRREHLGCRIWRSTTETRPGSRRSWPGSPAGSSSGHSAMESQDMISGRESNRGG